MSPKESGTPDMGIVGIDALNAARRELAAHNWLRAYELTTVSLETDGDACAEAHRLDVHAEAAWWLGRLDECIAAREAAFAIFDECNDSRRAAQCAVWLHEHYAFRAQPTIGAAWLRRGRRLVDGDGECVEYGYLVLRECEAAHSRGDLQTADDQAATIVDLARRLRSPDLEALALQTRGRVLIDKGRPRQGLELLDEAMLFALEGRLSPYATGKVYCSLISACEQLGDVRRVAEWTDVTTRWSAQHPAALFPGVCRVHHAWALQCRGEWSRAEAEARQACEQLAGISRTHKAAGYGELGEIRRRLGDLDRAETAFREAEELNGRQHAGLALVRLSQGRVDAASTIITQALEQEQWSRLARAKLLPAQVQIALAAGDDIAAGRAVDELDAIAGEFDSVAVKAAAATARGRLLFARSEPAAAATVLRQALTWWQDLEMPYEAAIVRVLLGEACRALGNEDSAATYFVTAEAAFEALGAALEVRATRQLHRPDALPAGLTAREAEVIRLVADGSTNKDIAAALYLSDKTVARHISNIFTKLGVGTRSAATAFAFEHGLAGAGTDRRPPGAGG